MHRFWQNLAWRSGPPCQILPKIGATSRLCGAKNVILGPWVTAIQPLALRAGGNNNLRLNTVTHISFDSFFRQASQQNDIVGNAVVPAATPISTVWRPWSPVIPIIRSTWTTVVILQHNYNSIRPHHQPALQAVLDVGYCYCVVWWAVLVKLMWSSLSQLPANCVSKYRYLGHDHR